MIKQLTNLSHTMKCKCYECQIVDKINELVRAFNETGGECTCNINLHNSLKDVLEAEKTCEVHKPTPKPQEGWDSLLQELMVEVEGKRLPFQTSRPRKFHGLSALATYNLALDDVLSLIKSKRRG